MIHKHPFPSFGFYAELVEGLNDLTLVQIEDRYAQAQRFWSDHKMVEQYRHHLQAEQQRVVVILAHAINAFRKLTYGEALRILGGKQ